MAAVAGGMLEYDGCSTCSQEYCESMGCEKPSQSVVWELPEIEFYTCPIRILNSSNVLEFHTEFQMLENGYIQPDRYQDKQARWFDAVSIYKKYYNDFVRLKQQQKNKR